MIYLIGGTPRVGKSTLSSLILERNNISVLSTDVIRNLIDFSPTKVGIKDLPVKEKPEAFFPYFLQLLKILQNKYTDYIIERATKNFIPEIIEVINKGYQVGYKENGPISKPHFSDTYIEDIESSKIRVFVAQEGTRVVGSVQYEDRDGVAYLSQMTVDPDFRKRGIGSILLQTAENSARDEGFKIVQLIAMLEKGLPDYYEKLG